MTARRGLLWGVVLVALLAAGYFIYKKYFEWVDVEVDIPMSVQARKHDLLAASRYLDHLGYQSVMINSSDFYQQLVPVTDTIVLQTVPDSLPVDAYDRLLNWVDRGGHLMIGLNGNNESEAALEFLESLGINHTDDFESPPDGSTNKGNDTYLFEIDGLEQGDPITVEMDLQHLFTLWAGTSVTLRGLVQDLFAFVQMEFGSGHVSVFADSQFWSNEQIGNKDNARLLASSVAELAVAGGSIYISDKNTNLPGVFTLIWQRWRWFCLLVAVLGCAWLRQAWVRFGPIGKEPESRSNNFARHLLAVAQFQERHQSADRLLSAARQRVLNRYTTSKDTKVIGSTSAVSDRSGGHASGHAQGQATEQAAGQAVGHAVSRPENHAEILYRVQQASGLPVEQVEQALFKSANRANILRVASTLQAIDRPVEK